MAEQAPEHQDRGLFGLFGKKKEEGKHDDDQILHPPATHTQNEAAGHGHEGQLTPEEAEKQKHTGLLGKLHRGHTHTHSSSSSSSSDEEEEGRKKKEGGRKKKGAKDKNKEKLPGGGQHSSDQRAGEEEKKAGLLDKIKEKLPGHDNKKNKEGEEEEKK
uniref:Dehydrin 4 n=1 Tax=Picea abies TaxID=3329 RepID=A9XKN1_PICAB|nr:dehydrin 4 [Picea abies]